MFVKLPVGKVYWGTERPLRTWHEAVSAPISSNIIEKADSYSSAKKDHGRVEELGGNYYKKFNRIMMDIFELKRMVCGWWLHEDDIYQAHSLADEIVYWLDENIGSNKYVGKFHITGYAEQLQERIDDLSYLDTADKSTVRKLAKDIDYLASKVCAYFKCSFDSIKEDLGQDADFALNELLERRENGNGYQWDNDECQKSGAEDGGNTEWNIEKKSEKDFAKNKYYSIQELYEENNEHPLIVVKSGWFGDYCFVVDAIINGYAYGVNLRKHKW